MSTGPALVTIRAHQEPSWYQSLLCGLSCVGEATPEAKVWSTYVVGTPTAADAADGHTRPLPMTAATAARTRARQPREKPRGCGTGLMGLPDQLRVVHRRHGVSGAGRAGVGKQPGGGFTTAA